MKPKIVIVNDTASYKPFTGHAGCVLVMQALYRLCEENGFKVIGSIPVGRDPFLDVYRPVLEESDLVIVNGEGTIHHNRPQAIRLLQIGQKYPAVLINSVLQDMDSTLLQETLPEFKLTAFRESLSFNQAVCQSSKVPLLVPDLTFAELEFVRKFTGHSTKINVGITDSVNNSRNGFPITVGLRSYLMQLRSHSSLVCGRFHAICMAAMSGIPFSAYPSNTHKNKSIMQDMGIGNLYAIDVHEAEQLVPEKFPDSVKQYVEKAPDQIREMFLRIKEIVYGTS